MAYSLLWYAVYVPLTSHGYWVTQFSLLITDTFTGLILIRKSSQLFFALWTQGSLYFLLASPQDFLIWTMILAGKNRRYGPVFLVLAVLTKLPLLPPIFNPAIWNYILYNPYSVHDPMNWARYTLIGSYWLLTLGSWLYKRGLLQKLVNSHYIHQLGWGKFNNEDRRNTRSASSHRDRLSTRRYSCNQHIQRIHRSSSILWSAVIGHHRTTDLCRDYPLRGNPAHQTQRLSSIRHDKPIPKPEAAINPKALNPLRAIRRFAAPSGLFLILILAVLVPLAHADVIDSYTATPTGHFPGTGQGATPQGQCFKPSTSAILSSASFLLARTGSPSATYAYAVYATTGSYGTTCVPTGPVLATSLQFSVLQVSCIINSCWSTVIEAFTGANQIGLTGGTAYALALTIVAGNDDSGDQIVMGVVSPGSHPGNDFDCTPACTATATDDAPFTVNGATSSTPGQSTQCYGNCGTVANTNSTHTINFNNSLTIFYQSQSNLNGFIVNETTRVAKSYSNGLILYMALYTVDSRCTATAAPFSPQCPGFLGASTNFLNPQKGLVTMQANVPVVTGQWIGIAVSSNIAGLDINNTSTSGTLYQTGGITPNVVTQFTSLGQQNTQIYATILGFPPGGGSPGPPNLGNCAVTCGLIAFWNSMGGDTAAGIAVFFVLFGIIGGVLFAFTRGHGNAVTIMGPLMMIFSMLLLIMLSAAGILPVYIPVLMIITMAWLFTTSVLWRRHGGGGSGEAA